MQVSDVVIVGGGVAGLMTAVALRAHSFEVTLLPGSGNAVSGNSNWRTHVLTGLTGKLSIESTGSIACCILGSNASAGSLQSDAFAYSSLDA